jgi:exodeoxyribonuclease V beta subunit
MQATESAASTSEARTTLTSRRHLAAHHREQSGEDLRLLYVALTRAQCQVVTWWAPSLQNTSASALHRLLFGAGEVGREPADEVDVPGDYTAERVLTVLRHAPVAR